MINKLLEKSLKEKVMNDFHTKWLGKERIHKELTDSTSNDISRLALSGAKEGIVVTADMQTAGKGRRGRIWKTEAGTSLLFSMLLRPKLVPDAAPQITLLMAMAVAKAIRNMTGLDAKIKWPNDVVVNGKKVCGILTEMQLKDGRIDFVVVGTGVNMNQTSIPAEFENSATSLWLERRMQTLVADKTAEELSHVQKMQSLKENGESDNFNRNTLLESILNVFEEYYELFLQKQDLSDWVIEYNEQLVSFDKEVKVLDPKGEFAGISKGINEKGELLVVLSNGEVVTVYAGEVSVRGLYGYV